MGVGGGRGAGPESSSPEGRGAFSVQLRLASCIFIPQTFTPHFTGRGVVVVVGCQASRGL